MDVAKINWWMGGASGGGHPAFPSNIIFSPDLVGFMPSLVPFPSPWDSFIYMLVPTVSSNNSQKSAFYIYSYNDFSTFTPL